MDPTASYLNLYRSIEYFLFTELANVKSVLLVSYDDYEIVYDELLAAKLGLVWKLMTGSAGNHGELTLFIGATSIEDPGSVLRHTLFDDIKAVIDVACSVPVYEYRNAPADPNFVPTDVVNQLALVGNLRFWPTIKEANGFKTSQLSVKLKYGQIRT